MKDLKARAFLLVSTLTPNRETLRGGFYFPTFSSRLKQAISWKEKNWRGVPLPDSQRTTYFYIFELFPCPPGPPGPSVPQHSRRTQTPPSPSPAPGIASPSRGAAAGALRPFRAEPGGAGARQPPGALREVEPAACHGRGCAEVRRRGRGRTRASCRPSRASTWEPAPAGREPRRQGKEGRKGWGAPRPRPRSQGKRRRRRRPGGEAERPRSGAWSAAATPRLSRKRWKRGWTITATSPTPTLSGKPQGKAGRRRRGTDPSLPAKGRCSVSLRCFRRKRKSRSPTPTLEGAQAEARQERLRLAATAVPGRTLPGSGSGSSRSPGRLRPYGAVRSGGTLRHKELSQRRALPAAPL